MASQKENRILAAKRRVHQETSWFESFWQSRHWLSFDQAVAEYRNLDAAIAAFSADNDTLDLIVAGGGFRSLRANLKLPHRTLQRAAQSLRVPYHHFRNAISGGIKYPYAIRAIQAEMKLSDETILKLWPGLKSWGEPV